MAPVFTNKLESIRAEEGQPAKFMVKVSGHPPPTVTWWVNGMPAKNVSRLTSYLFLSFTDVILDSGFMLKIGDHFFSLC